jgi:hypothetical protein
VGVLPSALIAFHALTMIWRELAEADSHRSDAGMLGQS